MYSYYIKIKPPIFIDSSFCQEKRYLKEFKLRKIISRFAPGIIYSLWIEIELKIIQII